MTTADTVAQAYVGPLLGEVVEGVNGVFVVVGASKSGKSHLTDGPQGLFRSSARLLFEAIEKRQNHKAG